MSKKKKEKLDEGMILISPLLPVGGLIGMPPKRKDNFKFKGLPGQFNEHGEKVLDEFGDPIKKENSVKKEFLKEDKKSFKVWSNDIIRIAKRELDEISYLLQKNNFEVDEDEYTAIFLKKVQKALDSPGVTSKGKSLKRSTLGDLFF